MITFNNGTLQLTAKRICNTKALDDSFAHGFLIDSGAPYWGIGAVELATVSSESLSNWNGALDPMPESLSGCNFSKFGTGEHASPRRPILGYFALPCRSICGKTGFVRHLVIDESSQWVIDQNITCNGTISQLNSPVIGVRGENHTAVSFKVLLSNWLLFMPFSSVFRYTLIISASSSISVPASPLQLWGNVEAVVDRVHLHVCGHTDFTDIKLLLQRNNVWSDDVKDYLGDTIRRCRVCRATSYPQTAREVSL